MKVIKGKTSRTLRQEFEHLSKMPSVWTCSLTLFQRQEMYLAPRLNGMLRTKEQDIDNVKEVCRK